MRICDEDDENLQEVWTICRIFKLSATYKKQPGSYKTSITTRTKSPTESSSVTNCGDPDDYVCCTSSAGGSPANQLQLLHRHHHLNHPHPYKVQTTANLVGAGAWTYINNNNGGGHALFPANSSSAMVTMNEQISPSSNDFMRDSIWDELGRISEFLADDVGFPSNDSGYASYVLEIDNVI
ncbi:hypothetical protein ZIOFF_047699 [Zingiber officinale]|uniref:Uncharacterized protein n=1 Tax=Zingiber officinale TaxID=94328 RepID=A0A8J5FR89_ZINOF|nr:hypothetical protein ZIOFF_047699 [Zingiber officinale]